MNSGHARIIYTIVSYSSNKIIHVVCRTCWGVLTAAFLSRSVCVSSSPCMCNPPFRISACQLL